MLFRENEKDIITIFFALVCFIYVLHAININNTKTNSLFYFILFTVLFIILNISKIKLVNTKNTVVNFINYITDTVGSFEKIVLFSSILYVGVSIFQIVIKIYKSFGDYINKTGENKKIKKVIFSISGLFISVLLLVLLIQVFLKIDIKQITKDSTASIYNNSNQLLNINSEKNNATNNYKSILDGLENNTVFLFIIFVVLLLSSTELLFMFVENWYSSNGYKNIGKNLKIICYNNFTTRYNRNVSIKHLFFGLFVLFYFYILSSKTFNNTPIGFPLVTLFVFIIVFYTTTLKTSKLDKEYFISYYKDLKSKNLIDISENHEKDSILNRGFKKFVSVILGLNVIKMVFVVFVGIFFIVLSKITGNNYTETRENTINRFTNSATIYLYGLIFFQIIICILGLPTKLLFMGFVYVMSVGYLTKDTDIKSQEMINYELRVKEINKKLKYNKIILCIMVILSFITTIYINRNYLGALIDKLKKRQKKLAEGSKCE